MFSRFALIFACAGGLMLGAGNGYAALATADVIFDWATFTFSTTGDLSVNLLAEGDEGNAFAQGGLFDSDSTAGFGGIDVSSTGPSSSASVLTTPDLIHASAATSAGFAGGTFERAFSFEALSGSGDLSLSVEVQLAAEVQGASSSADAEALFGYAIGNFGVQGSFAGLELYGGSGDHSETLTSTLAFSLFMQQGDVASMFAEGGAEVNAIPVPAAAWLFGSGLIGLFGAARHKAP